MQKIVEHTGAEKKIISNIPNQTKGGKIGKADITTKLRQANNNYNKRIGLFEVE